MLSLGDTEQPGPKATSVVGHGTEKPAAGPPPALPGSRLILAYTPPEPPLSVTREGQYS